MAKKLFTKTKQAGKDFIGSISDDFNGIVGDVEGFFDNPLESLLGNKFDQRIADGLSDLLTGLTGIRTSNIPAIERAVLAQREANRQARQLALSAEALSGNFDIVNNRKILKFPEQPESEELQPGDTFPSYIHFRTLPRFNHGEAELKFGKDNQSSTSGTSNPVDYDQLYDIFLMIPDAIQDNIALSYKEGTMGVAETLGANIFALFGAEEGPFQAGFSNISGSEMLEFLKRLLPGSAYRDLRIGLTDNPLKFNAFEGINLKSYTYQFTFRPRNPHEARVIHEILYAFRVSSLPGVFGDNQRFYTFPNEFSISFDGLIKNWIDFPQTAICTGVEIDHGGGAGYAGLSDGFPAVQTMSLTFVETVALDKKRYIESVSSFTGGNLTRTADSGTNINRFDKDPEQDTNALIDNINAGADSSNPNSETDPGEVIPRDGSEESF